MPRPSSRKKRLKRRTPESARKGNGRFKSGAQKPTFDLDHFVAQKPTFDLNELDTSLGSEPRDKPRERYTHLGWRQLGDDRWIYLHAGGAIGADGPVDGVRVDLDRSLRDFELPDPPSGDELVDAVKASLDLIRVAPNTVMVPLLGAVYLAPLVEMLPVDSWLSLVGPAESNKSALSAVLQSHWGVWTALRLLENWTSTESALRKTAFLAKDCLLVIDDFDAPDTREDSAALHGKADKLISLPESWKRSSFRQKDASLTTVYFPRGVVLSVGEDCPRWEHIPGRFCVVDIARSDVDIQRLGRAEKRAKAGLFSRAMAGYVRWLAPRVPELKAALPVFRREVRDDLIEQCGRDVHPRALDQIAALYVGWLVFLRFAVHAGAISEERRDDRLNKVWPSLLEMGEDLASRQGDDDPVDLFFSTLVAALADGLAHVADSKTGDRPDDPDKWGWRETKRGWEPRGQLIGWLKGDDLYLDREELYRIVGASVFSSKTKMGQELRDNKHLVDWEKKQKKLTVRRTVGADRKVRDVLWLRASRLPLTGSD